MISHLRLPLRPQDIFPQVPGDRRRLRGVVRHVASGTETPFRGDEEVLNLLHHSSQTKENERCVRREAAQ